jgi:hypothetical protein
MVHAPSTAPSPRRSSAPVTCSADALEVCLLAVHRPLRHETVAFLVDAAGYGSVITVVSGTHQPDHLFRVVECLAEAGCRSDRMASIVIASVRPHSGLVPGDIDRWFEASAVADAYGLELKEWFVVSPAGVECARELVGEPERW